MTILPYKADAQAMTFVVDAEDTVVTGELAEGAHATITYAILGDENATEPVYYATAVDCSRYAPVPFELSGLVTTLAGNAMTLTDVDGEQHGLLLTDTSIEGELTEGVHAVATCHKETIESAETIVVDKLVCSGFVDTPKTIQGRIEESSGDRVTVSTPLGMDIIGMSQDGASLTLRLTSTTAITGEIIPGSNVTAVYHDENGEHIADSIDVVNAPAPVPQAAEGQLMDIDTIMEIIGLPASITLSTPGGEMVFSLPNDLPDGLLLGSMLRVHYYTEDEQYVATSVEILDTPAPCPDTGEVEGEVTQIDRAIEIIGEPPAITLAIPGGAMEFSVPSDLPEGIDIGLVAHVHYHTEADRNIADSAVLLSSPVDDPFNPVPRPSDGNDPFDPVPAPIDMWVEGYLLQRLDDPSQLLPGQLRSLVVSAAGQAYTLLVPDEMILYDDVQEGALLHIDYYAGQDGQNTAQSIFVMCPAPQPIDDGPFDPVPYPVNDDEPFDPVPYPVGNDESFDPVSAT